MEFQNNVPTESATGNDSISVRVDDRFWRGKHVKNANRRPTGSGPRVSPAMSNEPNNRAGFTSAYESD